MRQKIVLALLLIFILLLIIPQASAEVLGKENKRKAVLILMDNTSWADIIAANDPYMNELIDKSSIGLLNNRAFRQPSRVRNALTVGAGLRAYGSAGTLEGYNANEPYENGLAKDAYKLRTGKTIKEQQVLELGIAPAVKDNENDLQDFNPGELGRLLNENGRKTAVLGNSDISLKDEPSVNNREAVAIAMNGKGVVDYGDVGKGMLAKDPGYPFGIRTDYNKLKERYAELLKKADFIVIDLGDTTRADYYASYSFKRQDEYLKSQAIHAGARFIEEAVQVADSDTLFIIASISPPGATKYPLKSAYEQMTPIIVYGQDYTKGGLVSDSARRDGLVTIIDIAPTVLGHVGITKGEDMAGSRMRTGSTGVTAESLDGFNQSAIGVKETRRTAVLAFIYIQIALFALTALFLALKKARNKKAVIVLETLIFTTMAFPLFSFYTTKIGNIAAWGFVATALTVAISLIFAVILVVTRRNVLDPIIGVTAVTLGALAIDALAGGPSFINTIFGYDPIRGSRFYGIGNEAMAILVANTLLLFGIMLEKAWNRWTVLAGFALCAIIAFIIGFPRIGANTGGTIAAVFAFSAMLLQVARSKNMIRNVIVAVAAVIVVLGGFVAYDALSGATTHMGKTISLIGNGGMQEVIMIVNRKVSTNIMVLRYSTWSYFLLIVLLILAFLWFRPAGVLRRMLSNHRGISAAISASIIGSILGFAFNDSGILIPAIIMSYMIPTVIYLMLKESEAQASLENRE